MRLRCLFSLFSVDVLVIVYVPSIPFSLHFCNIHVQVHVHVTNTTKDNFRRDVIRIFHDSNSCLNLKTLFWWKNRKSWEIFELYFDSFSMKTTKKRAKGIIDRKLIKL